MAEVITYDYLESSRLKMIRMSKPTIDSPNKYRLTWLFGKSVEYAGTYPTFRAAKRAIPGIIRDLVNLNDKTQREISKGKFKIEWREFVMDEDSSGYCYQCERGWSARALEKILVKNNDLELYEDKN